MGEQPVIMCAVDLSWRSRAAFTQAVALATSRRARLNLVFAVPVGRPFNWRVRERVALLAELRRQAAAADVAMTVSVQHGTPADVILTHANAPNTAPDLIVLGAAGRRGFERLPWSAVAQAVVHKADRPTLVVPGSPFIDPEIAIPFRRVLCAIDFSPASMSALDEALRILRNDGGTMRLLHVIDIAQPSVPRGALEFDAIDYTKEFSRHAARQLRSLMPLSEELHGRVHPDVAVGLVVDEIARSAREMRADLVVLGVTRRRWRESSPAIGPPPCLTSPCPPRKAGDQISPAPSINVKRRAPRVQAATSARAQPLSPPESTTLDRSPIDTVADVIRRSNSDSVRSAARSIAAVG